LIANKATIVIWTNLLFAWVWMTCGLVAGAVQGIGFHDEKWMGGYHSWRRRLTRLGHIAFIGTGMLNLALALSALLAVVPTEAVRWPSLLLLVGALSMPLVCYLSVWRKPFRLLFFVPVLSLTGGCGWFTFVLFERVQAMGVLP
jgi:hypothetical protein